MVTTVVVTYVMVSASATSAALSNLHFDKTFYQLWGKALDDTTLIQNIEDREDSLYD